MARRPTTPRRRLEALLETFEPQLAAAFRSAVDDISSNAEIGRIVSRLEAGDIDGAIRAVHLDPAAFLALQRAVADAYIAGGAATVGSLPVLQGANGRVVIRFDPGVPRAAAWLSQHPVALVTRITADQELGLRSALVDGLQRGDNPRTTALDVIGRINRQTGRREGGVIGLTSQQTGFVSNARAELLSGDPTLLRAYMERTRRDKRFDRTVFKAIRDGEAIPRETVNRMVGRYSDSLLQLRGETVARTESLAALNASTREAYEQAIENGAIRRQDVRKVWRSAGDARVRDSHAALNGESVGIDERFSNGMLHPHEAGAPAEEVINCRCVAEHRIDFLANVA